MTGKRSWRRIAGAAVVMTALAAVPTIYSSILTDANIDPTGHLDTVPAAVVNEDVGATDPDGEPLAVGDELAETLVDSEDSSNFDWRELGAAEAERMLDDGEVYAVLEIPSDFSANVASPGEDDPSAAAAATVTVTTNDGLNMISGNIASTIGQTVTDALRHEVSAEYLDKIYLGFTDVHASIEDAAGGASELADGAGEAKDGSGELVVGLAQLADGTARLEDGAWTLTGGARQAADGAGALSAGLQELETRTAELPDQTRRLDDGARRVADGAGALSGAVDGAIDELTPVVERARAEAEKVSGALHDADRLADDAAEVRDGIDEAADGATAVGRGLDELGVDVDALGSGASDVQQGLRDLAANYDAMSDDERRAALARLQEGAAGVSSGVDAVRTGVDGMRRESSGLDGLTGLVDEAGGLRDGLDALGQRAGHLGDDFDAAVSDVDEKVAQVGKAAGAVHQLRDGAASLAKGTGQLAAQSPRLVDGIRQAGEGAAALADGTEQVAGGASQLADGASSAAGGSADAADGAGRLDDGVAQLADGSGELRDGLRDGAAEVPSYSDGEASALSEVTASSVTLDSERVNEVAGYGAGLAPYFLSLALWVGGMSFYMMADAVSAKALRRRAPAPLLSLRSLLPGTVMGLVQATIAVFAMHFWVGVEAVDLPGLFALAAFASVVFLAVNQALIALLGAPGRFLALLMVVLQVASAGGTYPIETAPAFFQAIHHVLPMTYTVEAFRSMIAGGSIGVGAAVLALALWLLGALAVSVLAAAVALRRARRGDRSDGAGDDRADDGIRADEEVIVAATAAGSRARPADADGGEGLRRETYTPLAVTAVLDRPENERDDAEATVEIGVDPARTDADEPEAVPDAPASAEEAEPVDAERADGEPESEPDTDPEAEPDPPRGLTDDDADADTRPLPRTGEARAEGAEERPGA